MSKITAIEPQKHNANRLSISLDGAYAFSLDRITAAWLTVGRELGDLEIKKLLSKDEVENACARVMRLLSHRARSRQELERYLQKHGYETAVREAVFVRLTDEGYLDDARFASEWLDNRATFRPRSHAQIRAELRQKGIAEDVIEETLASSPLSDAELALQAARKAYRRFEKLDWQTFRVKMGNVLMRRGFGYSTAAEAVKQVWDENHPK
ncbi:MAG TPA: regulatory protein RecX [Anaerolineaceae bacterium]|nr:regulatory protein RecX [Chloroflexota bacterium]HNY83566.1 regulatory protein RecX [Anaerolineaceae bacterium]